MIKKNIKYFFLVFLGLFFIAYYLYVRLIMHRDILFFTYNVQLIYLCCIFIFFNLLHAWIIEFIDFFYELWFEKKTPSKNSKNIIKKLKIFIEYILMPFNAVYDLLKKWHFFEPLLFKIITLNYWFSPNYQLPYIIFNLFPRIIIIITLFIDIKNGYLYYFYYSLPLLIIVFVYKLILKKAKEIFLERLDHFANTLFNFYWVFEEPFNILVALIKNNIDFNKVYFFYYEDISLNEKSNDFLCLWRLIYMSVVFLTTFSHLPYENENLYNTSRILHFILAMQWWYILFHILLTMPTFTFIQLYTFMHYVLKIFFLL